MNAHPGPRPCRVLALAALLPVLGCSILGSSDAEPTLLVYNATCDPGPCVPLTVYVFPADQPHTPGGLWSIEIGWAMDAFTCFQLPSKEDFQVQDASSGAVTTVYTWTVGDPVAIGSMFTYESRLADTPSTAQFVPTSSEGWRVTLPDGGAVLEDAACAPVKQR